MKSYVHPELATDFSWQKKIVSEQVPEYFAHLIDSTILKQDTTAGQIEALCCEALSFQFRSVCIPPIYVKKAAQLLEKSNVKVCTVIGFPLGYATTANKISEIKEIINYVGEIDFVQNVTHVKNKDFIALEQEFKGILQVAEDKLVKVILETALLTNEEIYKCATIAAHCGIHVVKTSTGFSTRGASLQDIELIKNALDAYQQKTGNIVGIKASGGVRSIADAFAFVKAGASRLGTSGGLAIMQGRLVNENY